MSKRAGLPTRKAENGNEMKVDGSTSNSQRDSRAERMFYPIFFIIIMLNIIIST
jgi:hypothetical protein